MNLKSQNKKFLLLIPIVLIIGLAYFIFQNQETPVKNQVSEISPTTEPIPKAEVERIEIGAVGDYTGNGIATRSFSDSKFTHTVEANLPDPAKGKFYEGWLVKKTPSLQFFSTGKLNKDNDQYVLYYETEEDKSEYNEVVITEETESLGLDNNPEIHVLEGNF